MGDLGLFWRKQDKNTPCCNEQECFVRIRCPCHDPQRVYALLFDLIGLYNINMRVCFALTKMSQADVRPVRCLLRENRSANILTAGLQQCIMFAETLKKLAAFRI